MKLESEQKFELVDLLAACPLMQDRATRDLVVQELPFWEKMKRDSRDRFDIIGIVNTCLAHRNGIDLLLQAMRLYEGKLLTLPFETVLAKWDEWQQANQRKVEPTPTPIITSPRPKIEFDWVTIPAGEFLMGSNDGYDDEKPMHKLYLPEYKAARVPVTNEQWGVFLQDSGYEWFERKELWKDGLPRGKEKHPVVHVTWHDAVAFCRWANTLPSPSGRGAGGEGLIRLPTEAEWEKAARGADGRKYPWGNQEPLKELANYGNHVGDATPVGIYPKGASPYGCLDMAGNVWEWCVTKRDGGYKPYPYQIEHEWTEEYLVIKCNRILRGGPWGYRSVNLRCACRFDYFPDLHFNYMGFRCFTVPIF